VGVHGPTGNRDPFLAVHVLMVVSIDFVADELFERSAFEVTRHDLAFCVGSKRSRIANFAAKLDQAIAAFMSSGLRQHIRLYWTGSCGLAPVKRIRPRLFGRATAPYNVQEALAD